MRARLCVLSVSERTEADACPLNRQLQHD